MAAQPSKPSQVWLVNRGDALLNLSYRKDGDRLATSVPLAPGANVIDRDVFERCGVGLDAFDGRLRVEQPWERHEMDAIELAKRTGSRQALNAWANQEQRKSVKDAIAAKLSQRLG